MDDDEGKGGAFRRLEMVSLAAFAAGDGVPVHRRDGRALCVPIRSEPPVAQAKPRFNAIDYAETGSTKSATVIIGPCDTRRP